MKIRLQRGRWGAGQGELRQEGEAVGTNKGRKAQYLLFQCFLLFANWLKAELVSLLRWGMEQRGTLLTVLRSALLGHRSLDVIILPGGAFWSLWGGESWCSQIPFCVACFLFQTKSSSFPKNAHVPSWHIIILLACIQQQGLGLCHHAFPLGFSNFWVLHVEIKQLLDCSYMAIDPTEDNNYSALVGFGRNIVMAVLLL